MTLETFFTQLNDNGLTIALLLFAAPWLVWVLCHWIPGQWEEPFLLSLNLGLAAVSLVLWAGYLAYATNTAGWAAVVKQANMFLLLVPPYYFLASIWVARQRMPLSRVPAFRTLQGIGLLAATYLIFSWLSRRVYVVFFSRLPFSTFLWILAGLLGVAYIGYRLLFGDPPRYPPES